MYRVEERSEVLLTHLIEKHITKGSTIYNDGWSAYFNLNDIGYDQFTILHKFSLKKIYRHKITNEKKIVHTNRIEGAWKHAKDYFRKMSGTNKRQLESYLAEVIWRNHSARMQGNVYEHFLKL